MRSLLVVLAALLFFASDAAAQVGSASLLFQHIDPVSRSRALGEVGVLLRGEPGIAALNPAAVASPHRLQVQAGRNVWNDKSRLGGFAAEFGGDRWALAYRLKYFILPETSVRGASDVRDGTISADDVSHKLVSAYDVTSDVRIGVGLNYLSGSQFDSRRGAEQELSASEFTFDVGLHYTKTLEYELLTLTPVVGWSLTDVGGAVEWSDEAATSSPTMMRGGLGLDLASKDVWANRPAVRLGLYAGASKWVVGTDDDGAPYGALEALVKTWQPLDFDLGGGEDDVETLSVVDQLMWHRGLEVSLMDILSFRFGAFSEHEYNGGRDFGTFGWGLDLYYVAINTAVSDYSDQPQYGHSLRITTVSVRVPLDAGADPSNFWPAFIDLIRR